MTFPPSHAARWRDLSRRRISVLTCRASSKSNFALEDAASAASYKASSKSAPRPIRLSPLGISYPLQKALSHCFQWAHHCHLKQPLRAIKRRSLPPSCLCLCAGIACGLLAVLSRSPLPKLLRMPFTPTQCKLCVVLSYLSTNRLEVARPAQKALARRARQLPAGMNVTESLDVVSTFGTHG
eukprot:868431-Pleurochrysis_carterae.AAC.1